MKTTQGPSHIPSRPTASPATCSATDMAQGHKETCARAGMPVIRTVGLPGNHTAVIGVQSDSVMSHSPKLGMLTCVTPSRMWPARSISTKILMGSTDKFCGSVPLVHIITASITVSNPDNGSLLNAAFFNEMNCTTIKKEIKQLTRFMGLMICHILCMCANLETRKSEQCQRRKFCSLP